MLFRSDATVKYSGRPKPEDEVDKSTFVNPYEEYKQLIFVNSDSHKIFSINLDNNEAIDITKSLSSADWKMLELVSMPQSIMISQNQLLIVGGKLRVGYSKFIFDLSVNLMEDRKTQKSQPKIQPKGKPALASLIVMNKFDQKLMFPRAYFGIICIKRKVYVVGGITDGETMLKQCEIICPDENVVSEMPPLSEAKESVSVCNYQNRWLFVFGGRYHDFTSQSNMMNNYANKIEQYDVDSKYWTVLNIKSDSNYYGSINSGAIQISLGEILVFGGIMKCEKIKEKSPNEAKSQALPEEKSSISKNAETKETDISLLFTSVGYNVKNQSFDYSDRNEPKAVIFTSFITSSYYIKGKIYAFTLSDGEEANYRVYLYDINSKNWSMIVFPK